MTNENAIIIQESIEKEIQKIKWSNAFKKWIKTKQLRKGDMILINNSFLIRDQLLTAKSPYYLCIIVDQDDDLPISSHLAVTDQSSKIINDDFKYYHNKSNELPTIQPLNGFIQEQLESLGQIIFILIGKIGETEKFSEKIDLYKSSDLENIPIQEIQIDPSLPEDVPFINSPPLIKYRTLPKKTDLLKEIQKNDVSTTDIYDSAIEEAYDRLKKNYYQTLQIPKSGETFKCGFLDNMAKSLINLVSDYKSSLKNYESDNTNRKEYYNVLRIAYDFESDANKIIRLLITVCDLKPIIFWMTLSSYIGLCEKLKCLSVPKWQNKASLKNYSVIIHQARNSEFHSALSFNHPINVDLDAINIKSKKLRLFSEYRLKIENNFEFEDKQLIEMLMEFTCSEEKEVDQDFWKRNLRVMGASINFITKVSKAIKILNSLSI